MTDEDWSAGFAKSLMVFLNGAAIAGRGPRGERIEDDSFLLLFNAHAEPVEFTLGCIGSDRIWFPHLDTAAARAPHPERLAGGDHVTIDGRSILVLADRAA